MVDLHRQILSDRPPCPIFFIFMQFVETIWPNNVGVSGPIWEILENVMNSRGSEFYIYGELYCTGPVIIWLQHF